ncbi:hypothetical protein HS088_TW12G00042 [Tripterygium wilfordii]|uniref:Transcription repressor n=1 Tax=Tripterygium wilfordii TaxID=458696 RepID=A0A7J7CY24_TRIWF|nr:transcription repressor OFP12-like [Tripterygium wilfordii]KAF5738849.1 hypothetical protein HS088_TW12G00042 [Tripterygium wilfordii]
MRSTLGKNLNLCFTKSPSPSPGDCDDSRRFYINDFNSLYSYTALDPSTSSSASTSFPSDSDSDPALEPDFAAVFASQRFFFSSPGRSNSITDSSPTTTAARKDHPTIAVKDSVAVSTDSPDPYLDFRRSMQEMVEARGLVDVKANWEYLHELLLCYLALNPKSTHKFIVGAFADLLVTLMSLPANKSDRREDSSPVVHVVCDNVGLSEMIDQS